MSGIFKFKQFDVDQSGCAMKINTDGVLLGALANADDPASILDIGTGTGVIALMLAQRFPNAKIDAVEIDEQATQTAKINFANSPFSDRLTLYSLGFEQFFESNPDEKYDLIVSNPPFYINSLKSPKKGKELAKHADKDFFEKLVGVVSKHLNANGVFCLISPIDTAELIVELGARVGMHEQKAVSISSFENSEPHRLILYFGFDRPSPEMEKFVIYKSVGIYSDEYTKLLQPYFIAF